MSEVTNLFNSVPKDGADNALQKVKSEEKQRNESLAKKHNVEVLATYNTSHFNLDTKDNF
jgi:hypothetical protein